MRSSDYYYSYSSSSSSSSSCGRGVTRNNVVMVFLVWLFKVLVVVVVTTTATATRTTAANNNSVVAAAAAAVAAAAQQQQQQSASASALSSYEAVRALDSYGDAVQLRNAQAAADVQGRLVIAMEKRKRKHSDGGGGEDDDDDDDGEETTTEIWIFSVPPPHATDNNNNNDSVVPHHHRKNRRDGTNNAAATTSSSGMVQQLSLGGVVSCSRSVASSGSARTNTATRQSSSSLGGGIVAIVCTGIQADAVWLTRQLRAFCATLWERYDDNNNNNGSMISPVVDVVVVAQAVAFAKRTFWQYPLDRQWKMPLMASIMTRSGGENNSNSAAAGWARPLGLRTLVLSSSSSSQTPRMQLVEPSGIIRPIEGEVGALVCMGKNSEAVQAHLKEKLVPKLSRLNQKQTQNAIFDALRHVLGPNVVPSRILLEIVSSNGIDRQLISRT